MKFKLYEFSNVLGVYVYRSTGEYIGWIRQPWPERPKDGKPELVKTFPPRFIKPKVSNLTVAEEQEIEKYMEQMTIAPEQTQGACEL